jgi:hypothetical protein
VASGPVRRRSSPLPPSPRTQPQPQMYPGRTSRSRPERRPRRVSPLARFIVRLVVGSPTSPAPSHALRAVLLLLLGLSIMTGAAMSDVYLHRGVETSAALPVVYQVSGRDLATNIDLLSFAPEQVGDVATTLQENGFRVVRQVFAWSDIEPTRGEFVWDRYDSIVEALSAHGIQIVAVLARSPDWARAPGAVNAIDAPPVEVADYANFVQQVAGHYKREVQFVQLWDKPNLPEYWGGTAASPVEYSDLLANGFNASRTGEPETRVVLAEFDPNADGSIGADLRYLQSIYDLGRSGFFDVVSARVDGGTVSPYDRAVNADRESLSRSILFRELMVAEGDVEKPIWLTHYGWRRAPAGPLSAEEQADFLLSGIQRARSEWPWMGLMFAWDFMPNSTSGESAAYALLNDDLTATPAFLTLSAFGTSAEAVLAGTGYVPMDSRPISYQRNWADQHLDGKLFRTTSETTASARLRFRGTGVIAWLRHSTDTGIVRATLDGGPVPGFGGDSEGSLLDLELFQARNIWVTLASGLDDRPHELVLTLNSPGELTIGGIVVARDLPLVWPVALMTLSAFVLVASALRELSYLAATRAGYLQRRIGVELRPPLPHMPDWSPTRRT